MSRRSGLDTANRLRKLEAGIKAGRTTMRAAMAIMILATAATPSAASYMDDQGTILTREIIDACQIPPFEVVVRRHLGQGLRLERSPTLTQAQVDCINQILAVTRVPVEGAAPPPATAPTGTPITPLGRPPETPSQQPTGQPGY